MDEEANRTNLLNSAGLVLGLIVSVLQILFAAQALSITPVLFAPDLHLASFDTKDATADSSTYHEISISTGDIYMDAERLSPPYKLKYNKYRLFVNGRLYYELHDRLAWRNDILSRLVSNKYTIQDIIADGTFMADSLYFRAGLSQKQIRAVLEPRARRFLSDKRFAGYRMHAGKKTNIYIKPPEQVGDFESLILFPWEGQKSSKYSSRYSGSVEQHLITLQRWLQEDRLVLVGKYYRNAISKRYKNKYLDALEAIRRGKAAVNMDARSPSECGELIWDEIVIRGAILCDYAGIELP